MDSALVVSCADKGTAFFVDILKAAGINQTIVLTSCTEARRLLLERDFGLVIVNAPLRDESGEGFARQVSSKGVSQVILVVKSEFYDATAALCEDDGVLTVAKPINKTVFWSALTFAKSASVRMNKARIENEKLKQKIEDIKLIDRAKWILITYTGINEPEAHRYIEKQAMDRRCTKRDIAESIVNKYEG